MASKYLSPATVANNDVRAFKMYLDEFCVALPFIEKSLYGNCRGVRSYVIFNLLTTNVPIIKTSQLICLICRANQLTDFYMMGTLVVKGLMKNL